MSLRNRTSTHKVTGGRLRRFGVQQTQRNDESYFVKFGSGTYSQSATRSKFYLNEHEQLWLLPFSIMLLLELFRVETLRSIA